MLTQVFHQPRNPMESEREKFAELLEMEDVSEVLVGYALRVYESPRTLQPDRVTS